MGTEALCRRAIVSAGATGAGVAMVHLLRRELRDFQIRIDPQTAHDSYAAWRRRTRRSGFGGGAGRLGCRPAGSNARPLRV